MRRRRIAKEAVSVSLFPFLAVLICTMGALIVLLVLVVQQARVQADTISHDREQQAEAQQASLQQLKQEEEDSLWEADILQQQRSELTDQLADKRLELSHLEDHIRRLEQQWEKMKAEAELMQQSSQAGATDQAAAQAELDRLQAEIEAIKNRLEQARKELAERERFYAIIPYRGPNGTQRRPIYIECRQSGIVIHPEEIKLLPRDFEGPLGPGNPLDAALRAIREHWARVEGDAYSSEPYPLLIVRPDGSVAYAMARAAMAAWDDEFGYELVEDDLELAYPPSDPTLKRLLEATVEAARKRQQILAAAMPSRFEGSTLEQFAVPEEAGGGGGYGPSGDAVGYGGGMVAGTTPGRTPSPYQPGGSAGQGSSARDQDANASRTEREAAANGQPAGDGQAGSQGQGQSGQSSPMPGAAIQSVAKTKGANWATPKKTAGATGITRPIRIECYADRLIIVPSVNEPADSQVVPLEGPMRSSMESFVSNIWNVMDGWGMAVLGGYWKPILSVQVHPGADGRFYELQKLLKDSGLDVVRRQ